MNILVTGARGMIGTALVNAFRNVASGLDRTRPSLSIDEVFACDRDTGSNQLREWCQMSDFVFHLAGVNRPENSSEYIKGNCESTNLLLSALRAVGNTCPVMFASSIQATLAGRFENSEYGRSKLTAENLVFAHGKKTGAEVAIYRFENVMGHSRPNYNSAVSTFCWAVANDKPYTVNDPTVELDLLYIDDLVQGMFDLLENKECRCEYDGLNVIPSTSGRFCYVPCVHNVTLGQVVDLLNGFKQQMEALMIPEMPEGSFEKKLYSLYMSYLPTGKMKRLLHMNIDARGSFTELIHTKNCGQISVNVIKPGFTKGEHWHNSKWEVFVVVSGRGLIKKRNINTGETVEFEVCGSKLEAIYMLPGWTHSITNQSCTEDLIVVIACNEVFDPTRPDTFRQEV